MKSHFWLTLLLMGCGLTPLNQSLAAVHALVIPLSKGAIPQFERLLNGPFSKDLRPIFTASEGAALAGLGDATLGFSLKGEFENPAQLQSFTAWARVHASQFKVEINPIAKLSESPLIPLQWGMNNRGAPYTVEVDDFTTRKLDGRAGEDIGLAGVPSVSPADAASKKIVVAVLDSGIDSNHPDLRASLVRHEAECTAQVDYLACVAKKGELKCKDLIIDHDGNGYPLDCNGWNFAAEDNGQGMNKAGALPRTAGILGNNHLADYVGHGTHVAGIIAAQGASQGGVQGVAPDAQILSVRVISGEPNEIIRAQEQSSTPVESLPAPEEISLKVGYGLGDVVARGVLYAVRSGAQIINMSLGFPDALDSELLRRVIRVARRQGVLLVAAAGNDSTSQVILPCRYDGVICVGAYGPDGARTFFSNYGPSVDVLAPGWNILSTYPLGLLPLHFTDQVGYEAKDGTSMAAPFVSGMLARMLAFGITPDEASARLLLGARATRNSPIENVSSFDEAKSASSISGNADLSASLKLLPQALIQPSHKESLRIEWDRTSTKIQLALPLINRWEDAKRIFVSITPESENLRLSKRKWKFKQWKSGQERILKDVLTLPDTRIGTELDFKIKIEASNMAPREFTVRVNLVTTVGADAVASTDLIIVPLVSADGLPIQRKYERVLTVLDQESSGLEYVGVLSDSKGVHTLELIVPQKYNQLEQMRVLGIVQNENSIKAIHKLRDLKTGAALYAIVQGIAPVAGSLNKVGATQVTWLDQTFRPVSERKALNLDIAVTYLPEDFQWQSRLGEWVPTWYSVGRVPPLDAKPYSPWKGDTSKKPAFYLYELTGEGVRGMDLPTDYPLMMSLLQQTPEQRKLGVVSVLLANGTNYALEYATAELTEGKWQKIQPISLSQFHNLRGLIASSVLSLDTNATFAGTAFAGYVTGDVGPKGSRRTTVLGSGGISSLTTYPLRNFDAVTDIAGTFASLDGKRQAQFALTKYEVQYHDATQGEQKAVMTSQNRFSFLPSIFTMKSFFPLLVEDQKLKQSLGWAHIPALVVPGDFIFSKATQVIVPDYNETGRLRSLVRPAKFHLESKVGCVALPSVLPASETTPAALVFFCEDRFLRFPVRY